jgi:hypothetical protein
VDGDGQQPVAGHAGARRVEAHLDRGGPAVGAQRRRPLRLPHGLFGRPGVGVQRSDLREVGGNGDAQLLALDGAAGHLDGEAVDQPVAEHPLVAHQHGGGVVAVAQHPQPGRRPRPRPLPRRGQPPEAGQRRRQGRHHAHVAVEHPLPALPRDLPVLVGHAHRRALHQVVIAHAAGA